MAGVTSVAGTAECTNDQLSLWTCCLCSEEIGDNEFRWWWNRHNVSLTPRRAHMMCFDKATQA